MTEKSTDTNREANYEGKKEYFMDIDRMVNEGLGNGFVTESNGLITESTQIPNESSPTMNADHVKKKDLS